MPKRLGTNEVKSRTEFSFQIKIPFSLSSSNRIYTEKFRELCVLEKKSISKKMKELIYKRLGTPTEQEFQDLLIDIKEDARKFIYKLLNVQTVGALSKQLEDEYIKELKEKGLIEKEEK